MQNCDILVLQFIVLMDSRRTAFHSHMPRTTFIADTEESGGKSTTFCLGVVYNFLLLMYFRVALSPTRCAALSKTVQVGAAGGRGHGLSLEARMELNLDGWGVTN